MRVFSFPYQNLLCGIQLNPNVFVDISGTLDIKIKCMEIYESDAQPFPYPRSPEALRAIAQTRGSTAGLKAAEGFELVRCIK